MTKTVTVLAPFRLAPGKTEQDLITASDVFEREFVSQHPGVLRRELLRKSNGSYMDVVQFRSQQDMETVVEAEMASPVCHAFFAVMDMSEGADPHEVCVSLATYDRG